MGDEDSADSTADFAAAALLRLIAQGLAREGLAVPGPVPDGAHVTVDRKRDWLRRLPDDVELPWRLGLSVQQAPAEPLLHALQPAQDLPDLIARWQRLERYVHARHRVRVLDAQPGSLRLVHDARRAGDPPPWPVEDRLVWGLIVGLARRLGLPPVEHHLDLAAPQRLELRWAPQPLAGGGVPSATPAGTLEAARAALAADPAASWTLPRLAQRLGLAPRTLQRRLADAGSGFGRLWTAVRLDAAAPLLVQGGDALAEIGYRCGFADQAHFTRLFHQHLALTPARFRAEFRAECRAQAAA
ncbi:MAG: helix-turn-helix transcriptional regulator [Burkholderiaceae bacterium]|nr:helix-turn-helix transcriptional regulator [Burkholderiaceae bacterium]